MRTLAILILAASTATAGEVSFGATYSTAYDQIGFRMEHSGDTLPGAVVMVRGGDDASSYHVGFSRHVVGRFSAYATIGAQYVGEKYFGATQVGVSARWWDLRAHFGLDLANQSNSGIAAGVGWRF